MAIQPVALVTGSSSGIGAAIASQLARDGYRVFGGSRRAESPAGTEALTLDVCSDDSVRACISAVIERGGRIDVLVNNAGQLIAGAIEELTLEQARSQFETNFFGVARTVLAVLPHMRAQRSGKIITLSSLAGLVPVPFWGYYNASKFAVEGYCETLCAELKPFGISVSMVEPGAIGTSLFAQPQATKMDAYTPWRDRALQTMKNFETKAPTPEVVARAVGGIVAKAHPPLRTLVTTEAHAFTTMRRLLPGGMFESLVRFGFALDRGR
jgi:NAD(P)-dependent dehydrogenase (short-subunit alcohol dehydrogenase family)